MFVYAQVDGKTSMYLVFVIAHCSISFWELGSSISIYIYIFQSWFVVWIKYPFREHIFQNCWLTLLLPKNCSILHLAV